MKKLPLFIAALFLIVTNSQASTLILTAIYDGNASTPKGIEVFVAETRSFNGWTIDVQSNANTNWTTSYTFNATVYNAGTFLYITSTASDPIFTASGFTGTVISDGSFNQNGNDRFRIFDGASTIDQYGVTDVDGSGQTWEYTDSFAIRKSQTAPNGSFVESDWTISAPNSLSSGNAPLEAALGTFQAIPEPSSTAMLGLAILGLALRRRK